MTESFFLRRRVVIHTLCALIMMVLPAGAAQTTARAAEITDEQVVTAMKHGIDSLLRSKSGVNWESGRVWSMDGQQGGETSLVLYALLNAGESLRDDPVYADKLNFRSPDLAPTIDWLCQIDPKETYTAGLMASALALVPRRPDDKPGQGPQAALENAKFYLLTHLGAYGGYTYSFPGEIKGLPGFLEVWEVYFNAKLAAALSSPGTANAPPAKDSPVAKARNQLDRVVKYLIRFTATGPEVIIQHASITLNQQLAKARKANDAAAVQRLELDLRELQKYAGQLPKDDLPPLSKQLADAQKEYAAAQHALAIGDPTGLKPKWVSGGGHVNRTKEEIPGYVDECKQDVANLEFQMRNHFVPIGDLSNSQYGTLGCWALADYGIEISPRYWQIHDRFWRLLQRDDGGWAYATHPTSEAAQGTSKLSMTAAAVASIYVADEFTDLDVRDIPRPDKIIDRGLDWLTEHFDPKTGDLYALYGVERVGLASGRKFFGTVNWYKEAAAALIKRQSPGGEFPGAYSSNVATSYGLLFLARGRNPVIFNKLQYNGPWNARPRDDANVTHWMSKQFERPLNWQVVNLQVQPEEWLDAPLLLITGGHDPKFTPEDIDKLRAYVQAGGIVFSIAESGGRDFTDAMKRYATQLVNSQYEMRDLPKTHPIFSKEMWVDIPNPPQILGMSNGIRELWIHSTVDLSASWQGRRTATKDHFSIPANLFRYATGKEILRSKLQSLAVTPSPTKPVRTVALARIDYPGNWDPEPGAWPRMVKLAQAQFKTDLHISNVKPAALDAKQTPVAHMTGTAAFTLGADNLAALRKYLEAGGTLLADAAGGSTAFNDSFLKLAAQLFPGDALDSLPADHPMITGNVADGVPAADVEFRRTTLRKHGAPPLLGLKHNGRIVIIMSPLDFTSGLLGTRTYGIQGYSPEFAQALVRNFLVYISNPNAPAVAAQIIAAPGITPPAIPARAAKAGTPAGSTFALAVPPAEPPIQIAPAPAVKAAQTLLTETWDKPATKPITKGTDQNASYNPATFGQDFPGWAYTIKMGNMLFVRNNYAGQSASSSVLMMLFDGAPKYVLTRTIGKTQPNTTYTLTFAVSAHNEATDPNKNNGVNVAELNAGITIANEVAKSETIALENPDPAKSAQDVTVTFTTGPNDAGKDLGVQFTGKWSKGYMITIVLGKVSLTAGP